MNVARLGLIVNPSAGRGAAHNLGLARRAVIALAPDVVVTGAGPIGGDALTDAVRAVAPDAVPDVVPDVFLLPTDREGPGRDITMTLACDAVRYGSDALLVVGGDGTLSDVALALDRAALRCPIIGVGAGSTNVGALVTCLGAGMEGLAPDRLSVEAVDALAVRVGGAAALAFNDVVVATTIVGTLGEDFVNLDADAFVHGRKELGTPRPLSSTGARVTKVGAGHDLVVGAGEDVGCVVVGFTECPGMYGKALVGGIALSSSVGVPAGCIVASFPLVFAEMDRETHRRMEPLKSSYVGLDEGETLEMRGLADGAYVCADGNPLKALTPDDVVEVRVRPRVVDVARMDGRA